MEVKPEERKVFSASCSSSFFLFSRDIYSMLVVFVFCFGPDSEAGAKIRKERERERERERAFSLSFYCIPDI